MTLSVGSGFIVENAYCLLLAALRLFLVGALRIKEPDYYSYSFFFKDRLERGELFVQFVQLNEYPGNASKLLPFHFLLL